MPTGRGSTWNSKFRWLRILLKKKFNPALKLRLLAVWMLAAQTAFAWRSASSDRGSRWPEIAVRDVGRAEAERVTDVGEEAFAGVGVAGAISFQVPHRLDHQLGRLALRKVQVDVRRGHLLVGDVARGVDGRIADGQRLVHAGGADTEHRILGPLVGAVQPAAFLGADEVELEESGELRIAPWA